MFGPAIEGVKYGRRNDLLGMEQSRVPTRTAKKPSLAGSAM